MTVTRMITQKLAHWLPLFLISSLGLFFELAIIRWVSGELRLLSYFKNLPLMAAFLGLALGFALVGKGRDYRDIFAPLLGLFVVLVLVVGRTTSPLPLHYPEAGEQAVSGALLYWNWVAPLLILGVTLAFFLLMVFIFIPLGQATGYEMSRYAPVPAYIVNLLASLAEVWAFSLLSYMQTPPVVWFGLVAVSTVKS